METDAPGKRHRDISQICSDVVNRVPGRDKPIDRFSQMRLGCPQQITEMFNRRNRDSISGGKSAEDSPRLALLPENQQAHRLCQSSEMAHAGIVRTFLYALNCSRIRLPTLC